MFHHLLRRAAPAVAPNMQARSLWYQVPKWQDADVFIKQATRTMEKDGIFKQIDQRFAHEKKWQRRIRKKSESEIRQVNKRMGMIIDFCLKKQKQGRSS
ncbi:Aste57867_10335 [Aphanomyces stellatus]|uniref:Aste57867_10335 protein n=1 Tax=Aphanomyces stellatus TaxID=120398 RepID=A0A485KQ59_9STRA|nr:hypothetical protein As57867_010295 [Aphanomyces stellatus]VFT87209.1 Aste57867_10335 [Aphanomyces stellatus]